MRVRVRHTKLGKIRFTSHRDTARHWERAVRKAEVPLVYSAGFTPRPRMSFGLALPTGGESLAEYLDMELAVAADAAPPDLAQLCARFGAALPVGYEVSLVVPCEPGSPSLQEDVVACTWQLVLEGVSHAEAEAAVAATLARPTLLVERERKGQRSTDDVRAAIEELSIGVAAGDPATDVLSGTSVLDDPRPHLCAVLATNGRGLRPTELVAALFPALDPVDTTARVLRTHQWIERDGVRREIIPAHPFAARTPVECA
ncbi:MAG: TIGR03936 family radical SAM-associated protein [Actinomycetota bacterium]|nr:TIGR03936 family radical SAM-associated protein [Actinomycetota bacterium]